MLQPHADSLGVGGVEYGKTDHRAVEAVVRQPAVEGCLALEGQLGGGREWRHDTVLCFSLRHDEDAAERNLAVLAVDLPGREEHEICEAGDVVLAALCRDLDDGAWEAVRPVQIHPKCALCAARDWAANVRLAVGTRHWRAGPSG